MNIEAFIFDLDGVLTDTAEYHYQAWKNLADQLGMKFNRKDNEQLKGVSRLRSLEIILEINGKEQDFTEVEKNQISADKNKEYVQLIQQIKPGDVLPGVLPFLKEARKQGLKLAIASASKNAKTVLRGLEMEEHFDYVADASKIKNSKPDPEVFLNCAENLGVPAEACVGFEDAQAGVEAIHAAGMYAVGIGVEVVSEEPDLALANTEELDFMTIIKAASKINEKSVNDKNQHL